MFRADLKIGEKLSIPKKRILFQPPVAWFNGLIAQRRLVEVSMSKTSRDKFDVFYYVVKLPLFK